MAWCVAWQAISSPRRGARDGWLILPAVEDDSFCLALIVGSEGAGGAEVPAVAGSSTKPDRLSCKPIEIAMVLWQSKSMPSPVLTGLPRLCGRSGRFNDSHLEPGAGSGLDPAHQFQEGC